MEKKETKCQRCGFKSNKARCPKCKYNKYHPIIPIHNKRCNCRKCKQKRKEKPKRRIFGQSR